VICLEHLLARKGKKQPKAAPAAPAKSTATAPAAAATTTKATPKPKADRTKNAQKGGKGKIERGNVSRRKGQNTMRLLPNADGVCSR